MKAEILVLIHTDSDIFNSFEKLWRNSKLYENVTINLFEFRSKVTSYSNEGIKKLRLIISKTKQLFIKDQNVQTVLTALTEQIIFKYVQKVR